MISVFKWLALVLIFLNAGYFIWMVASDPDEVIVSEKATTKAGKSLKLLDELSEEQRLQLALSEGNGSLAEDTELEGQSELIMETEKENDDLLLASEPFCPSLGPFDNKIKLKEVGQRLADSGLKVEARTVVMDSSEKFRVYLPPYFDRDQAEVALKKLRAKKIDSYIMSDNDLNNAISLGIFSSKDSAEGLVKKMNSHSFYAEVQSTRLDKEVFWLDLSREAGSEKADEIIISVMSEIKGVTRIDSPCKVVALP
jgi:hypothetical protein